MIVYGQKRIEIREVDRSDLIMLGRRLKNFIIFYEKYVRLESNGDKEALFKLKQYSDLLEMERYDLLLKDTSIIYDDISDNNYVIEQRKPEPQVFSCITDNERREFEEIINDDSLPF